MVLLGIRTAGREDPNCSPAELVYGSTLRLSGEFVEPTPPQELQPSSAFLHHLQKFTQDALPPPVKYHSTPKPYLPPSLSLLLDLSMFALMGTETLCNDHTMGHFGLSLHQTSTSLWKSTVAQAMSLWID